jgi:hypothetical protein
MWLLLFLFGGFYALANGLLLLTRPEAFLKFYDFFNRGSLNKSGEWRRHVHESEYKFLGAALVLGGLFLLIVIVRYGILGGRKFE